MRTTRWLIMGLGNGLIALVIILTLATLHAISFSANRVMGQSELPGWSGHAWFLGLSLIGPFAALALAWITAKTLSLRLNASGINTYVVVLSICLFVSQVAGLLAREWTTSSFGHLSKLPRVFGFGWEGGVLVGGWSGVLTAAKRIWSRGAEGGE